MKESGQFCKVVLLHGGWHCSASWWKVASLLQRRGHIAVTPDLPGHGPRARFPQGYFTGEQSELATSPSTLGDISLESAADEVVSLLRVLRSAAPDGLIVLVSHSSAGAIASLVAETVPETIDRLVYIAAIVPTRLASAIEVGALPEYGSQTMDGLVVADPTITRSLRINPRSADPGYRDLLREKFYGDLPAEEADAFINLLIPDQPIRFLSDPVKVTSKRWGSIPRTYVHTTQDRSIARSVQQILVDDADSQFREHRFQQIELSTSHCPFASEPNAVMDAILGAISA